MLYKIPQIILIKFTIILPTQH